ncbi:RTX toxin [Archangium sp.]|uniref:RCC1 domain-containing protein n=1 Tax=Archangium sp. TaxID=1872627 RepID=UPI002D328D8E|nr:RTX toxin [Archangium sp.]HYO59407.1 RTX toxin [Archangium sp.]
MTHIITRSSWLRTLRKATLLLSAFNLAVGCSPSQPSAPTQQEQRGTSTASFSIQAADITLPAAESGQGRRLSAQAFSYADVKSIRIDVKEKGTGNVLYANFDLGLVPIENVWKGDLPFLPKGVALTFSARAFGAPGTNGVAPLLFNGTLDQTFSFDNETVVITLSAANDKQTIQLPRIRKISVPKALGSDQSGNISFAVEATTGETLQYAITGASGGGTFYPVSGAITLSATTGTFVSQYVSPSVTTETDFEHTVKVTNEAGHSVSTTFKTKVKPTGSSDGVKDAEVSVLFNPVINSIAARRVMGTGNVLFDAGVADDGDVSTLVYAWGFTATPGTSFTPPPGFISGTSSTSTLENYTPLVQGKVELKVTDAKGGTTTLFYNLTPDQFPDNPIVEGDTTGINTIRAGESHTCVLLSNGTVRCWGRGTYGQLGYGSTANVGNTSTNLPYTAGDVPVVGVTTRLVMGANHTCALLNSGYVRCWGLNNYGQLGLNSKENVGDGEAISSMGYVNLGGLATQLAAGNNHTCALLNTGNVRCWGYNGHGQLGINGTQNIGDDEAAWSGRDVQVGTGITVKDIVAGGNHTCVITDQNKVRCWGYNGYGQLGYNNTRWIGDDEYPYVAGDVNLGGTPVQLSAGANHTCALLDTGNMRCWGYNASGQLGYGTGTNLSVPGGDVNTGGKVLQMSTGSDHTCALLSSGTIKCWGYNGYGQLGYNGGGGLSAPSITPMDLSGATAYRVSTGTHHTCALLSTGAARCWGMNNYGQLGYGHTNPIGDNELPAASGDIKVMTPSTP